MDVRFFGLAHSHDNGRPVATFPPTAPPQDMLTRRGWSIVVILIIGKKPTLSLMEMFWNGLRIEAEGVRVVTS